MKIGLLGFGVVGRGVYDLVADRDDIQVAKVLCLEDVTLPDAEVTKDYNSILNDETIDTVVEAMGGLHPAYEFVRAAMEAGKNIVTSNKALVATFYDDLIPLAMEKGLLFRCTAAVGGGIGWLSELERARRSQTIQKVGGIMNGTCNYILDSMTRLGLTYADALSQAQALGYAEADPTADVTGLDALRKIMLGCAVAYDRLPVEGLYNEGIDSLTAADVAHFQGKGLTCRLLAKGGLAEGKLYAYVQPALLPADAPECAVKKNFNMAKYLGKNSGQIVLMGQGAGRYPTASAVIRDLECIRLGQREMLHEPCEYSKAENDGCLCTYYVRMPKACVAEFELAESEVQGGVVYAVTKPISVKAMHEKVRALRKGGMPIFFAEI